MLIFVRRQHIEMWKVVGEFPKIVKMNFEIPSCGKASTSNFDWNFDERQFVRREKNIEIETSFDIIYGLLLYFT